MASVPPVRLPMENPPEGYWEERDLGACEKEEELYSNSYDQDIYMGRERERERGRERERERVRERKREERESE